MAELENRIPKIKKEKTECIKSEEEKNKVEEFNRKFNPKFKEKD